MPIQTNTTNASEEHLALSSFEAEFQFSGLELVSFTNGNGNGNHDDDDCFDVLLDDNDSVQYSGDLDKCLFADSEDEEDLEVLELVGDIKKSLRVASYKLMPSTNKLEQSWTNTFSLQSSPHSTLNTLWSKAAPSLE
jgi:hypothetical protein